MIAPQTELILKRANYEGSQIWLIFHPIDLREDLQYKNIRHYIFRPVHRRDYETIKSNGTTLIYYEE